MKITKFVLSAGELSSQIEYDTKELDLPLLLSAMATYTQLHGRSSVATEPIPDLPSFMVSLGSQVSFEEMDQAAKAAQKTLPFTREVYEESQREARRTLFYLQRDGANFGCYEVLPDSIDTTRRSGTFGAIAGSMFHLRDTVSPEEIRRRSQELSDVIWAARPCFVLVMRADAPSSLFLDYLALAMLLSPELPDTPDDKPKPFAFRLPWKG